MAKANRLKGITIEIGGETTELQKSLKNVDSVLSTTQDNLKDINKLLKFDPKNTELLRQKQEELNKALNASKDRVDKLKAALKQMQSSPDAAKTVEQQKALTREIAASEQQVKKLETEYRNFGSVAAQKIAAVGGELKKTSDKMAAVGQKMTVSLTAPLVAMGAIGVNYNAKLEQYRTMFTTLLGSAEEADRVIGQIQEDAQKSPFDTASLIEANQYLISAGVEADEARKTVMALGDAVAATGGGSAELSRMAQNLQQIKNVGKASAQDIKQFANAGINIYGLLAESMGTTVEEVKDMDVSYDLLAEALSKASSEGGKYFGAMEAQSQTLNGSLSNTKENIEILLGQLTEQAMPLIIEILQAVSDFIKTLQNLDPETKKTILTIASVVAALGPVITVISKVGSVIATIMSWVPKIQAAFVAVKTFITAQAIPAISSFISAAAGIVAPFLPYIAIAAAVVAAGVAIYKNWDTIKEKAVELWEKIKEVFGGIKDFITEKIDALVEKFNAIKETIKETFSFDNIKEKIGNAFSGIGGFLGFGSGGYMSSGFNGMAASGLVINNSFTLNSQSINEAQARAFANIITDQVNEKLGRMI